MPTYQIYEHFFIDVEADTPEEALAGFLQNVDDDPAYRTQAASITQRLVLDEDGATVLADIE